MLVPRVLHWLRVARRDGRGVAWVFLAALGASPLFAAQPGAPPAPTRGSHSIKEFLKPDGTLELPPGGLIGSIDPAGYQLAGSPPGAPLRFAAAPMPAPPDSPFSPSAADDNWSALGAGMNGSVQALAWDGTGLYAGGDFTIAGGTPVNCIARWNGSS